MVEHTPLIKQEKISEYETYRPLKYLQEVEYKHKYDNRLHFSLRYKTYKYDTTPEDELFKINYHRDTLRKGFFVNFYFI
jgi:hypothetical protein